MRISHSVLPAIRLTVLIVFVAVCAVIFGYLWDNSGGRLPFQRSAYQLSASFPRVANLVPGADVMVAGVRVGEVAEVRPAGERARVTMELDNQYPVHEGATVRVRNKTLVEETFLEISDGDGAPVPSGATLPDSAGQPPVQLNDVLASLDQPTREALASAVRSLGGATEGSRENISRALTGLGYLGREGQGALAALSAQSDDLSKLTGKTATLLAALDTSQGQIARLVADADTLTRTTADGAGQIEAVLRRLPPVLDSASAATDDLDRLSTSLAPIAQNLRTAAPDLSAALRELPRTSADLRGLLPSLDGVLNTAPDTLTRVPAVAADAQRLLPTLDVALADVNPMLAYLRPYGPDVASMFANMAQSMARGDTNGRWLRTFPPVNEQSVRGNPLNLNQIPLLDKYNPYPAPGEAANPGPFDGEYPRVQRDNK
ncbi:MlaD family protein [Prauserella oleivorans]|uniref:Virulence factor Mce n=7 Tax=Pseudonocardiaceae TaxID=2070 RepID=A0A2V4ADW1_9PSEU|nr:MULTISPECIES: MlaD family protein [Pseudonocardiaceae]PXY18356.1 virulence factor Mce [Prauserella coralliicola]AXB46195.1 virulence factor Mce [Amycolatopsis albispora]EHR53543.1 ABC-type transport system involved in resistance to organic solvents, periplasmic component [Saccharomonospora marina XMU15]MCF6427986.1 MCE family protein [Amycolatopsis tucumanensis]NIJ09667.1 phospholipid/cholesterol/gamma-HCH transport system substrate-binding protein [Saccharomonospora amisosensis]